MTRVDEAFKVKIEQQWDAVPNEKGFEDAIAIMDSAIAERKGILIVPVNEHDISLSVTFVRGKPSALMKPLEHQTAVGPAKPE